MPSGKVHDQLTFIGAALAAPIWYFSAPQPTNFAVGATLVVSTLFSGLFLSPDLDLDSSIYRRWGPFRFIWWPYQKAMPHRSQLSHSFVLAPALRLAYFLLVAWLLFRAGTWLLNFVIPIDRNALSEQYTGSVLNLYRTHPAHFQAVMYGILLGTALHVGADLIWSAVKRTGSGKRRRKR
jgi:uncharacterized metal-binding protein